MKGLFALLCLSLGSIHSLVKRLRARREPIQVYTLIPSLFNFVDALSSDKVL